MITASTQHIGFYLAASFWEPLSAAVAKLGAQTADALGQSQVRVEIRGEPVVGNVDRYSTLLPDAWPRFESHRKMIDLQIVLAGRERIDVVDTSGLTGDAPYDTERDMQFYKERAVSGATSVILVPQTFALLFPHDAHRPKMAADKTTAAKVTKIVFKIPVSLWGV
ncbi:MAG: YhcH/YjgK/YiaL family protein [Thermoguttaceae bacterium]